MRAVQAEAHRHRADRGLEQEAGPPVVVEDLARGPEVGRATGPERHDARRRPVGHREHRRVIGVEDNQVAGRLDELALRRGDGLHRTELPEVRGPDIEHHGDIWSGDAAQEGDVAEASGAVLQHGELIGGGASQAGQRQAELVVERTDRRQRRSGGRQHVRHQVLGRGLTVGSGDADRARLTARKDVAGQGLQGDECIGHHEHRHPGYGPLAQHRNGSGGDRGGGMVQAVSARPGESDEQAPRSGEPAVHHDVAGDLGVQAIGQPGRDGLGERCDLGQRPGDHASTVFRAWRTTSRSSNGVTTPARSCPDSCPLPATSMTSPGCAWATA